MTFQFMTSNLRQCTFQLKSFNLLTMCLLKNVTQWPLNPHIDIYYEISQEKGAIIFQLTTTGLRQCVLLSESFHLQTSRLLNNMSHMLYSPQLIFSLNFLTKEYTDIHPMLILGKMSFGKITHEQMAGSLS
jgi:hypothetical protein